MEISFQEKELFLLDMDGTMWIEKQWIDGALNFLEECKRQKNSMYF